MAFIFPDLPKLSLWDIACSHTGQNAIDRVPTPETHIKLVEFVRAARDHILELDYVAYKGIDFSFVAWLAENADRDLPFLAWHRLDDVIITRAAWMNYLARIDTASRK